MFNIVQYKKPNHKELFEKLSSNYDMTQIQNYIPIYRTIFLLNENNYNKITLNTNETLATLSFNMDDIHIKFAPIMDPFRYIMGKYSQYTDELFCLPTFLNETIVKGPSNPFNKINNPINSAYVDGFFYYLSTKLMEKYNFLNGVQSYGNFVGIKHNFKFKINDDLEYLIGNNYFLKNSNKLFQVDDYSSIIMDGDECSTKHTNKKNKINISNHSLMDGSLDDILDVSEYKNQSIFDETDNVILCEQVVGDNIVDFTEMNEYDAYKNMDDVIEMNERDAYEYNNSSDGYDCDTETETIESVNDDDSGKGDDDDSGKGDDDSGKGDDDDDSGKGDDDDSGEGDDDSGEDGEEDIWITESENSENSENSEEDEPDIYVTIDKFPVTLIAMEKCNDTLDVLIENEYFETDEMWFAMLMQIIMTLIIYQKAFTFTHNDLHTNNVMYIETELEYIDYIYISRLY